MSGTITIDATKLARLRQGYDAALAAGKSRDDTVVIDGDEFVIAYLGYLIEYAAMRLEGKG